MGSKEFLGKFKQASVTAEMLEEVAIAIDQAVRDGSGKLEDDPMWIIFQTFKGRNFDPWTITAIMFRMQALSDLVAAGKLSEWQLPGLNGNGAVSIKANVFEAASKSDLILSNRRGVPPKFNIDQFKKLALAAVEPEGRG